VNIFLCPISIAIAKELYWMISQQQHTTSKEIMPAILCPACSRMFLHDSS